MILFASQNVNVFAGGVPPAAEGGGEVAFHESAIFPLDLSYGSRGGPGHRTIVQEGDSGNERRIRGWHSPRLTYDVAERVKTRDQMAALLSFYRARAGATYGFRFEDWLDRSSAADHYTDPSDASIVGTAASWQVIGAGDGSRTTFQLLKRYVDGGVTRERPITKPQSGTVRVYLDGTLQGAGFTVDTTSGIVTFATAPGVGVEVEAEFLFHVPVRFGIEIDQGFSASADAFDSFSIDSVPIVEIKDDIEWPEERWLGGVVEEALTGNRAISAFEAFFFRFDPTTNVVVYLPDETIFRKGGGPILMIHNRSATYTIQIRRANQTTFVTSVAPGLSVEFWLSIDPVTGAPDWLTR